MGCGDEKLKTRTLDFAIGIVPVGYLVAVFGLPVVVLGYEVFQLGFESTAQLSSLLGATTRIAIQAGFQALGSAFLTIVLGLPLAGILAQYQFRGRSLLQGLVLVPFVLPTLVTGLAFRGLFADLLEPGLLLLWLSHVYVNLAVVVRIVGGAWEALDSRYELVAATLGRNSFQQFRDVSLPLLKPAIARAAALIFVFTFSSLGLVLLLGGDQVTLESQLLRQISLLLDFPAATITAGFQFFIAITVLALANRVRNLNPQISTRIRKPLPKKLRVWGWLYSAVLLIPMIALLNLSLQTRNGLGLTNWAKVFSDSQTFDAAVTSTQIASLTAVISVSLGVLVAVASRSIAWSRLPAWFALPLSVSSVTIGLGLLITVRSRDLLPIPDWLLPSVAHSLVALPFVSAILVPAVRAIDQRWFTIAASLGAKPISVYRVVLAPVFERTVPVALTLAVAISLGEFGAASFLANSNQPTLSVLLLRLATKPAAEALGMAAVIAVLLGAISLALSIAFQKQETK